jgi:hypothetical protein
MSTAEIEDAKDAILRAGAVDYLDVWFISGLVQDVLHLDAAAAALEISVDAIEQLLREGKLRPGDLVPPGEFVPWARSPDDAIALIRHRINMLGHAPRVGDIAWFERTSGTGVTS